jgi:hypothetical protein
MAKTDKTALIPFVIFGILAAFVAYVIIDNRPVYQKRQEDDNAPGSSD